MDGREVPGAEAPTAEVEAAPGVGAASEGPWRSSGATLRPETFEVRAERGTGMTPCSREQPLMPQVDSWYISTPST